MSIYFMYTLTHTIHAVPIATPDIVMSDNYNWY